MFSTFATSIFVVLVVVAFVFGGYVRDVKRLRRFPAPSIAAHTSLWSVWHNWHGRRFLAIDKAHKRLGPVVRIGPNHVSFASPEAYKNIYGHGSSIIKDIFYDNLAGTTPAMADTSSRPLHSEKRKNVSAIFSAKHVAAMEPKVKTAVKNLIKAVACKSEGQMVSTSDYYAVDVNGQFDLRPWLNMFSFDAFSDMLWSSSYYFLKRGNDACFSMDVNKNVKTVQAMKAFQTGVHFNTICAQFSPVMYRFLRWTTQQTYEKQAADHFTGMARYKTVQRLKSVPKGSDFFTHFPLEMSDKGRMPMSLPDLVAECTSFLNAGNDTTQISLTNTMFMLASHPEQQQRLYTRLMEALSNDHKPVAPYSELSQIPLLRACLDETFRLLPPVRFGLPRRTVGEGVTIAGEFIPGGVTVSSSVYTLHRDSSLFHSPLEWKPERWTADESDVLGNEKRNLKDYVLPFTLGGRACIGRNLAYMELSVCLAALVMSFEWTISQAEKESFTHYERFNSSPVRLMISAKARREMLDRLQ